MNTGSSKRSTLLKAFLASFAVYLVPIIGPHALWFLGMHLCAGWTGRGHGRAPAWIASEWGIAVALQVMAGALWYWYFSRPQWWRLLPLLICVPAFFMVIEWAFLVAIPSRFLIEQDTAPESGDWKTACVIPDMTLAPVRSGPDRLLEQAGQAWLIGPNLNAYTVLTMPGCQTTPAGLEDCGQPITQPFVLPGGRGLFSTWDNKNSRNQWWYHDSTASALQPLPRPPADPNRSAPILSTDGNWVAWLEYIPGVTVTPLPQQVVIRSLRDDQERLVNLPPPGRAEFVLLGVNMDTEEVTFYKREYATGQSSLSLIGLDGARRGPPMVADGVDPQATTFLRVDTGWVAWDAYRENEPYRIAWSLPKGSGLHRVLKGRGITAVALHSSGAYIAVSTTTALNIGHIKDAVYVLRTSDGAEVWRRYMPTYTRCAVAFIGESFFAFTEDWGGTRTAVRVLRVQE